MWELLRRLVEVHLRRHRHSFPRLDSQTWCIHFQAKANISRGCSDRSESPKFFEVVANILGAVLRPASRNAVPPMQGTQAAGQVRQNLDLVLIA